MSNADCTRSILRLPQDVVSRSETIYSVELNIDAIYAIDESRTHGVSVNVVWYVCVVCGS